MTTAIDENVCVDEQILPFKQKKSLKAYIKEKPEEWEMQNTFTL
jgi:hypothetical protein